MTSPSESEHVQTTPTAASGHEVQTGSAHGHEAHAHADEGPHFSEQEWKEFRDDDVHAGGAIVCLMTAIFATGLMLYTTIAIIVST